MIETAENCARDCGITREACDTYAVRPHQRAAAAWQAGLFADELAAVPVPQRPNSPKGGDPLLFVRAAWSNLRQTDITDADWQRTFPLAYLTVARRNGDRTKRPGCCCRYKCVCKAMATC